MGPAGSLVADPRQGRRPRWAPGSISATAGSRDPTASVPSKSTTARSGARAQRTSRRIVASIGVGPGDVRAVDPPPSRADVDAGQDRSQAASHDVGADPAERPVADDAVLVDPEVDRQRDRVPASPAADPSLSRPSGNVADSRSANAATVPSSSLTSMARITSPSSAWRVAKRFMSGNSSTHGGQYVPMKLTQTGLPLSVREVDRPAADLRHDERRGRLADVEQGPAPARSRAARRGTRVPAGERRSARTRRDRRARRRDAEGHRGARWRRRCGTRLGSEGEDPSEDQGGARDPGQEADEDRETGPHLARRVPVPTIGRRRPGPRGRIPLPCPDPTPRCARACCPRC